MIKSNYLMIFLFVLVIFLLFANTSNATNTNNTYHLKEDITTNTAESICLDNHEVYKAVDSPISFEAMSKDGNTYVDTGEVTLFVDDKNVSTALACDGMIDWNPTNNKSVASSISTGEHEMYLKYISDTSEFYSNTAILNVKLLNTVINVESYEETSNHYIKTTLSLSDENGWTSIDHGTIKASVEDNIVSVAQVSNDRPVILLPGNCSMKYVNYSYSDNEYFYHDCSTIKQALITLNETFDVNNTTDKNNNSVINPDIINTVIDVMNMSLIENMNTINDSLHVNHFIRVKTSVKDENNSIISKGSLKAYFNGDEIASNNNLSFIDIPVDYNMEDVELFYSGFNNYRNSSIIYSVYVPKQKINLYVPYLYGYKSGGTTATVSLSNNNNYLVSEGLVYLYLDGNLIHSFNLKNESNLIRYDNYTSVYTDIDLGTYSNGEYNLTAEYSCSKVFSDAYCETTLIVRRINTWMYMNRITAYVGTNCTLYAHVSTNNNETVSEGLLSFYLDKKLIGSQIINSSMNNTAKIVYTIPSGLTLGEHELYGVFEGNQRYEGSQTYSTLTLSKTSTSTYIKYWDSDLDDNIRLNITVKAWNKTVNGELEVFINNTKIGRYPVYNSSSQVILPESVKAANSYNITINYLGTNELSSSNVSYEDYYLDKKDTTLRLYSYLRRNGTLTATAYVYTSNYASLSKENVIFKLDDKEILSIPVQNNSASITYDMFDFENGNYTLEAIYLGTNIYNPSSNSTNLEKINYLSKTYLKLSGNNTLYEKQGNTLNIEGTLTSYSSNITDNIYARIILSNNTYSEVLVNKTLISNGILSVEVKLPENLSFSNYTLLVQTYNSTHFKSSNASKIISIGHEYTRIYQRNLWAYKQSNVVFNATLYDSQSRIINETINARIYITNTSNKYLEQDAEIVIKTQFVNGKLSYNYTLDKTMLNDNYLVLIRTDETDLYASSYRLVNMTLNNKRTYMKVSNPYFYMGNPVIFNGTIIDSTSKTNAMTNATVEIYLDGNRICEAKAVDGVFNYVYKKNITTGNHTVEYIYNGDNLYNSSRKNGTLYINRNNLRISSANINTKIGDKASINATIRDYNGKLPDEDLNATIKLNGKLIGNTTIHNGKLQYTFTVPVLDLRSNNLTITVLESNMYKSCNATIKLNVNKNYQFINAPNTINISSGSLLTINGNITDKYRNPINGTVNLHINGIDIINITANDGIFKFNYNTTNLSPGTYDMTLKVLESSQYYYNSKHITLYVT